MLVLTRKVGESVWIGSNLEVVLLDAGPGRIKLGFSGPREISIRRGELQAEPLNAGNLKPSLATRHEPVDRGCIPAREYQVSSLS